MWWTANEVDRVRSMWSDGKSAGYISEALWQANPDRGFSRCAVMGLVNRRRQAEGEDVWPRRALSRARAKGGRIAATLKRAKAGAMAGVIMATERSRRTIARDQMALAKFRNPPVRVSPPIAPIAPPSPLAVVPLLLRRDNQCAWPVGEANGPGTLMCGGDVNRGSYCAFHAGLAFIPRRDRRKALGAIEASASRAVGAA